MATQNKVPEKEKVTEITLDSFVTLVKQMRHNQKRHQMFNKPEIMATLEPLEKEVDRIIAELTDTQKILFHN